MQPTPQASSPQVRRRMQATRRRDTAPEIALRRELHRRGLRYRLDVALPVLPRRRMDIVFAPARLVVLVDGCFWHGCPWHSTVPCQNAGFWSAKIGATQRRDADTDARLRGAGWEVIRAWEHENPTDVAEHVEAVLAERRTRTRSEEAVSREPSPDGWGAT